MKIQRISGQLLPENFHGKTVKIRGAEIEAQQDCCDSGTEKEKLFWFEGNMRNPHKYSPDYDRSGKYIPEEPFI